MVLEAIIVLARQRSHIHVTRALRPVFIIDNVLMDGVRRYVNFLSVGQSHQIGKAI
jgi:two pore calcium channel protein 1